MWCGPDTVGCAEQREGGSRAHPLRVSPGPGRAPPMRVSRSWSCRLCRAARGGEQGPSPPGLAGLGRAPPVRVSRPQRPRLSLAARGREEGPSPPGLVCCRAPPVRVSRPWSSRLCQAARGREQGPYPPSLARLGPHTACAFVAAMELLAEPSSEREGAVPLPAGFRPPAAQAEYPFLGAAALSLSAGRSVTGVL